MFAILAQALGEDTSGLSDYDAACLAVEQVVHLNADLGIPANLGDVGVKAASIRAMSRLAMNSGNIEVNPRKTSLQDMERLFRAAL